MSEEKEKLKDEIIDEITKEMGDKIFEEVLSWMKEKEEKNNIKIEPLISLAKQRSKGNRTYRTGTILGITIGGLFALAGFTLCILGLSGSIEWLVEAASFKAKITNASPGVVFAAMGMVILWRYKPVVRDRMSLGEVNNILGHSDYLETKAPFFNHEIIE